MDTGHVTIGAMHTMGPIDLSLPLALFHDLHPGVGLTVREQSSEEMAEMLRIDELDLAFLSVTERVESHGLGLHQLVSEELVVLLPLDHPLSGRQEVRMAQLADEQFISFRVGARLRELLFAAGREAGFEPRVTLESNESQRIRRLVARGLGVAILPRSDAERPGAEVAVARLVAPVAAARHHAGLAGGPPPRPGRRGIPGPRARDVRRSRRRHGRQRDGALYF